MKRHTGINKRTPTFDLTSIKAEFSTVRCLRITRTAHNTACALGFSLQDIVDIIQSIARKHFYKSMTSYSDYQIWQDVYYVPYEDIILYIKFTIDDEGQLLISFKEK